MTNQTQIIKIGKDSETCLTIGLTNEKVYIDIRHYYKTEIIDACEITLSQVEWNLINSNLARNTPKLYRCPECGDIVTEDEIAEDCALGGYGTCMCLYGNGSRLLVEYVAYELEPDSPLELSPGEEELIRIIRRLSLED